MIVSLIVAADLKGGIGKNNGLPWSFPEDLKRFKRITENHAVIMGKNTYLSIGRPLPNRLNIVLSRHAPVPPHPDVKLARTLEDALKIAEGHGKPEVFIIGGANVYEQALPIANRIHLTKIPGVYECDAHFPNIGPEWREVKKEVSDSNLQYLTLENKRKSKDTPQDRYLRDPEFAALVNMFTAMIAQGHYTPSEIREAAILARTRYEILFPQPMFYRPSV